jgi:hypothetical protein
MDERVAGDLPGHGRWPVHHRQPRAPGAQDLRERDTSAISLRMYLVLIVGFVLWIAYGLIIASWPVVIFNGISLVLGGVMVWLKRQGGRAGGVPAPDRA